MSRSQMVAIQTCEIYFFLVCSTLSTSLYVKNNHFVCSKEIFEVSIFYFSYIMKDIGMAKFWYFYLIVLTTKSKNREYFSVYKAALNFFLKKTNFEKLKTSILQKNISETDMVVQSFTLLKADLSQDINQGFALSM